MDTIQITFNGKTMTVAAGESLELLLFRLNINSNTAVVECNGTIIRHEERPTFILSDGDVIQAFAMVGGG
jgi:thiamine biosynthesis protein ThiS